MGMFSRADMCERQRADTVILNQKVVIGRETLLEATQDQDIFIAKTWFS